MTAHAPPLKKKHNDDNDSAVPTSPWGDLSPKGENLSVDDFITTTVVRLGTVLRKRVTQSYVSTLGLTQAQWRILSVMAESPQMSMTQLVTEAVVDKALVSRILRQLEEQGLVNLQSQPNAPRKGLQCMLSTKGRALYAKAIPEVRQQQASMIMNMTRHERDVTYHALKKLYILCTRDEAPPQR